MSLSDGNGILTGTYCLVGAKNVSDLQFFASLLENFLEMGQVEHVIKRA